MIILKFKKVHVQQPTKFFLKKYFDVRNYDNKEFEILVGNCINSFFDLRTLVILKMYLHLM